MLREKIHNNFFIVLTAFVMLLTVHMLFAGRVEAAADIGAFSHIEGNVDSLKEGKLPAVPAKAGGKILVKDIVRTKSNSHAEILFNDGNILKIDQRSRVDISEYVSEDGQGKRIINLPRGKVEATVLPKHARQMESSPKASTFEIHTPNAVAGVRGTRFKVLHINGITWVFVFEGSVKTFNPKFPDDIQIVNAGFMVMVPPDQPPQPARPLDPALLGLDLNNLPASAETADTGPVDYISLDIPVIIPPDVPLGSFEGVLETDVNGAAFKYYSEPWPDEGGLYGRDASYINGSLIGSTDLWANPAPFTAEGTYYNPGYDTLFEVHIEGSTSDNSGFVGGLLGRVLPDNQLDGKAAGIYIKPDGTAGILFSDDVTGSYTPAGTEAADGTWMTSGDFATVDMGNTAYLPEDLMWIGPGLVGGPALVDSSWKNGYVYNLWEGEGPQGTAYLKMLRVEDQLWGILHGDMGNTYYTTPPADWEMDVYFDEYLFSGEGPLVSTAMLDVKGTEWNTANNTLSGKFTGYSASITAEDIPSGVVTAIMVGETIGTFNPGDPGTWQALNLGYLIETNTFLSMVQTAAGQAALQKLNIPSVEVGRANLTGNYADGSTVDITKFEVIFFAPSTGSAPSIWAAGTVNGIDGIEGTYSGTPSGVNVPLSGSGLSADFYIENWNTSTNRWLATVNGSGNLQTRGVDHSLPATYTNSIIFKGAAAGTFGSGSFSGTAAGISKPGAF